MLSAADDLQNISMHKRKINVTSHLNEFKTEEFEEARLSKYLQRIEKANLYEDIKFREVAKSREAIEEILRIILDDEELEVVRCVEQKSLMKSIFHGVILDCECVLKTKEIVNVEMQVDNDDDMIYRMRYNQAALTVQNSLKAKNFKYENLPKIISIMICNFDPFKIGKAIYEVKRTIVDTDMIADNGIREIYVNLKAKVEKGKLKELFKIFTDYDYLNEENLPRLTEKKKEINGKTKGGTKVTGISKEIYLDGVEDGMAKGMKKGIEKGMEKGLEKGLEQGVEKGILKAYIDIYNKGFITAKDAANMLKMDEDAFMELVRGHKK